MEKKLIRLALFLFMTFMAFSCAMTPEEKLKASVRLLVKQGQRADFSHDGKRLLYVTKAGGEVEEMDFATGKIRRISTFERPAGIGFYRALYLSNGDYLLTGGPARRGCVFYFLDRNLSRPPQVLNEPIWEGPAVSRTRLRIAWTPNHEQIWMGDISYQSGLPQIVNRKLIVESGKIEADGVRYSDWIEPQNFRPPLETELIFSQYGREEIFTCEVFGIDLVSGKIVNYSKAPKQYDEPEGIFPGGEYTLVESDKHNPKGIPYIDIYMLKLDASGQSRRLTFFSETPGNISSNPVISDDGHYMAFDCGAGRTDDDAGQKISIYLMDLRKAGIRAVPADSLKGHSAALPGDRPTRIDAGAGKDYTAADGTVWLSDRGFNNGRTVDRGDIPVNGTTTPVIFRTERKEMVDYTFTIPNGVYTVRLHLAETDSAVTAAGQRVFNMDINGWPLNSVDIFGEAKGGNTAIVKTALVEVTDGALIIRFMQRRLSAKLDALEIIPEPGQKPPPKPAPRVVAAKLPVDTPPCTRHFVLEDLENTTDDKLHKKWYQWGELSYWLDSENGNSGTYGVTHRIGTVNTSWFSFPPALPEFSCSGMNAWRMWVKPDVSGRFATFFIQDGSHEVYCWLLPDLLAGTEPYILEVPFANYSYIFRENNRVFDAEGCCEFGYWITGPCTFSLDDVMLVYNPELSDYFKPAPPLP